MEQLRREKVKGFDVMRRAAGREDSAVSFGGGGGVEDLMLSNLFKKAPPVL